MVEKYCPDCVAALIDEHLKVPEVEQLIVRMEREIRERHPQLFRVFVRPQSHERKPDPNADRA